jgi:hypothetical protein
MTTVCFLVEVEVTSSAAIDEVADRLRRALVGTGSRVQVTVGDAAVEILAQVPRWSKPA